MGEEVTPGRCDRAMLGARCITVSNLFAAVGLAPTTPVAWNEEVPEARPGVYVVARTNDPDGGCDWIPGHLLPDNERARWLPAQPIVYIGRTRQPLTRRLRQFYRHQYGRPSPHRGGQAILLLRSPAVGANLWVFWAPVADPTATERLLIDTFCTACCGYLPFGNRMRGSRSR